MNREVKGPFARSDFKDPILGSENWKQAFRRFRFQGSVFVVKISEGQLLCVHTIQFSELTKNLQFGAKTITAISCKTSLRLSLSRGVSDENRACSSSVRSFKITDQCLRRSFSLCSHDKIFGTDKNRILKNGLCERDLTRI